MIQIDGGIPAEVHLPSSPLVKVLVQMKFPVDTRISTSESIAPFQTALRSRYPIMRRVEQLAIVVGPAPIANVSTTVWRLSDLDDAWSVVLGADFIALETGRYESRDDFVSRWQEALSALESADLVPARCDRLGVRYINVVRQDEFFDEMERYVNDDFLGVSKLGFPSSVDILSTISQSHFRLNEDELRAVWGTIPPNTPLLPGIEPVPERSWVLDVDVFLEIGSVYEASWVADRVHQFAEISYAFFRWAMTDDFLRLCGGNV